MTALNSYIRLESIGLWRPETGAQRRDVYVFLGDASLMIADKTETALAHWSLPAIQRLNPGQMPALFGPGQDSSETLEIDDTDMIEALEQVIRAVQAADPKPGRLRLWIGLAMVVGLVTLSVTWLPGALVAQAERVVPTPKRLEIGNRLLAMVEDLTGPACAAPAGLAELHRLTRRIETQHPVRLAVLDGWPNLSAHLPGRIILLDRSLLDEHDTPDVVAGYALAEMQRLADHDPLGDLLQDAGAFGALQLLATGDLDDAALRRHADRLVSAPPTPVSAEALLARFEAARVSSTPYGATLLGQDDLQHALIARDPFVAVAAPEVMADNDWVRLQSICDPA